MNDTTIWTKIVYSIKENKTKELKSNMKKELIKDFLLEYIRSQMGLGEDCAPANEKDEYHIRISLDLEDDTYFTSSDTGNAGLTLGIVASVLHESLE